MQPSTGSDVSRPTPVTTAPTVSPSRKRSRDASRKTTKLDAPPPRRLRMRIDRGARIWAGRCGCKSPQCMADEFEFSSDTGVSDDSDDDSDSDVRPPSHGEDTTEGEASASSQRPPQDPDDLVPMLLHLMLMM